MGKTFFWFGKFSCIILLNMICIPLVCTSSPSNGHYSQAWSFDGVAEFLHIPFMALELFY
jgi:hypothetical protein